MKTQAIHNTKIQADWKKRVVSLNNLEAMCSRISGTYHRFTVSHTSPNRVEVEYSNPDEYGNEAPMQCVFPAYRAGSMGIFVVLDILNVKHDYADGEGWQNFQQLLDCPELFRSNPDSQDWKSRAEIEAIKAA